MHELNAEGLELLFQEARTHNVWLDKPVSDELLQRLYDLMKWGPTAINSCPARIVFVRTQEGKERLRPALKPTNVEKTMSAPVTAIIGYDTRFYENVPKLFPHRPEVANAYKGPDAASAAEETAFRNSSMQAGYLILAARALGLDCGPISGFDPAAVDAAFFPDGRIKTNLLCNLGYGDDGKVFPRNPRLDFEEACVLS